MRAVFFGIMGALLTIAPPDGASEARSARHASSVSALSIGSPNVGRLDGGARLVESPYLRVVPFYRESDARWGLPSLVDLIDRAARRVARRYPDAVLSVGDLSRRNGGAIDRHHSHESGRDADVGFYLRAGGKPLLATSFVPFTPAGIAPSMRGASFDESRNWALVEALVLDPGARVSFIFVAAHIRARLLRYAEQMGVDRMVRERAAEVMMQPRRAPHDDHFHVRIACPSSQRGQCVEDAVVYTARAHAASTGDLVKVRRRAGSDDGRAKPLPRLPGKPAPSSKSPVGSLASWSSSPAVDDPSALASALTSTSASTHTEGAPSLPPDLSPSADLRVENTRLVEPVAKAMSGLDSTFEPTSRHASVPRADDDDVIRDTPRSPPLANANRVGSLEP